MFVYNREQMKEKVDESVFQRDMGTGEDAGAFPDVARYTADTSEQHPDWKPVIFMSPKYQSLYRHRLKVGWSLPTKVRRVFLFPERQEFFRTWYMEKHVENFYLDYQHDPVSESVLTEFVTFSRH